MQQAHATTLKAATALGVAGTIALALYSTTGDDEPAEARPGATSLYDDPMAPELESAATESSTRTGLTPSASAEPKLVETRTTEETRTSRPETRTPDSDSAAAPTAAPSPASTPATQSEKQDSTTTSSAGDASTPDAPAPTKQSDGQKSDDGGRDTGLVGGAVDGVNDTVGGLGGTLLSR
ncbi:extensin [Streptomyces sp. KR80]|uniref:extensin n=1 Tax=Streptomyces sp. KR80 TaxID=3457426 RepID=UPI003FD220AD